MTAYWLHAVLMTAFDNLSHACSSIKSIQYTQFEQLTRTSQCLLDGKVEGINLRHFYSLGFYCGTPTSWCLKVVGGGGGWVAYRISLSAPGPFGFNWVLELIGTWFGFGLGGFWTYGLGPGLDNNLANVLWWSQYFIIHLSDTLTTLSLFSLLSPATPFFTPFSFSRWLLFSSSPVSLSFILSNVTSITHMERNWQLSIWNGKLISWLRILYLEIAAACSFWL